MKFEIIREDLLTPLQQVTGVVEKRQTLPILSNTLIKVTDGEITFTGTDLEVELIGKTKAECRAQGSTTVPARKFLDIVRLLPERCTIRISLDEGKFRIRSGHSRFILNTLDAGNFPEFDDSNEGSEFSIETRVLKKAMDKTMFSMGHQDVRYYLNGILMGVDQRGLKLVASDGHRLALYEDELESLSLEESREIIIPRKGVLELYRLLDDSDRQVVVQFSKNNIRMSIDNVVFSSKLIDGKYPDFSKIFSRESIGTVRVDRDSLRDALSRVSILSNEKHKGITVKLDSDFMILNSYNVEHDEAEEQIGINNPDDLQLSVGFNVQYLLDAVSNVDGNEAYLSFTEKGQSCFINDPSNGRSKFVVMPMRV